MYRRAIALPPALALVVAVANIANCLKLYVKVFYVMGKALTDELSCKRTGPEVRKKISCSTQLSMKFSSS